MTMGCWLCVIGLLLLILCIAAKFQQEVRKMKTACTRCKLAIAEVILNLDKKGE